MATGPQLQNKQSVLTGRSSWAYLHVCVSVQTAWRETNQSFVLDLLADELVFTQGVAGLSSDGVDGPLFHLLLDGAVQHEQRLPCTLL